MKSPGNRAGNQLEARLLMARRAWALADEARIFTRHLLHQLGQTPPKVG